MRPLLLLYFGEYPFPSFQGLSHSREGTSHGWEDSLPKREHHPSPGVLGFGTLIYWDAHEVSLSWGPLKKMRLLKGSQMSSSSYLRVVRGSPSALVLNLFSIFSLSNWSQSHHGLSSRCSGSCSCEVKVAQLCLTLCISMNYTVHGILQARILEWIAFPFSRGSSQPRDSNPGLPHRRQILYQLSHQGSPGILEWVAYPFSSGSS